MKTIFLISFLLLTNKPTFCDGWKEGYINGWCMGDPACLEPKPPLCPLEYNSQNSYQDGYNRGVVKGRADRLDKDTIK